MYLWYINFHLIAGISWMVFLLQFVREKKLIFNVLSLVFMLIVLILGTKSILLNPSIAKSGGWLHTKLSLVIVLMLENVYLSIRAFKKKGISKFLSEVIYWFDYIVLVAILVLSLFRPF